MIHSGEFVLRIESSFFVNILLSEMQMPEFGQQLGRACLNGSVVYLDGTLGMGKTTLSRSVIQGLGWSENVKSPTYTLVEQYDLDDLQAYHFDLYRLADPEELEFMGIRDIDAAAALWLVEWPDKGAGFLPPADLLVQIEPVEDDSLRSIRIMGKTEKGRTQLATLESYWGDRS